MHTYICAHILSQDTCFEQIADKQALSGPASLKAHIQEGTAPPPQQHICLPMFALKLPSQIKEGSSENAYVAAQQRKAEMVAKDQAEAKAAIAPSPGAKIASPINKATNAAAAAQRLQVQSSAQPEYGRAWYRGTLLMFDQKVLGPVEFEATKFRMWEFRNAYEVLERRGGRGRKEGREGER